MGSKIEPVPPFGVFRGTALRQIGLLQGNARAPFGWLELHFELGVGIACRKIRWCATT